ncbi:MAG: DUF1667 domain-containing protein [Candidatus Omnitrophica bacterium]|nr:DUF1667 domain-containing protein [Candidatus Omnitrophota bacterium]
MIKELTCIECPKGCSMKVDVENCRAVKVAGNNCPKGVKYAEQTIAKPQRILTSSVLSEGLALKLVPVRTDKPIPKARLAEAMDEVKRLRVKKPVVAGEVVVERFLGLEVNLIATRDAEIR